jgi:FMN phosphatase YigB (HAD superfamily)
MMQKMILTDCDGVLLDWSHGFRKFLRKKGIIYYNLQDFWSLGQSYTHNLMEEFNNSSYIGFLPPYKDSLEYVRYLHKHGYVFGVITSLSDNIYTGKLRERNLKEVFGDTAFNFIWSIKCMGDKTEYLRKFEHSQLYWIEDRIDNAEIGASLGLKPILLKNEETADYQSDNVIGVNSWKEIYDIMVKQ